jgi:hypothetical protein
VAVDIDAVAFDRTTPKAIGRALHQATWAAAATADRSPARCGHAAVVGEASPSTAELTLKAQVWMAWNVAVLACTVARMRRATSSFCRLARAAGASDFGLFG